MAKLGTVFGVILCVALCGYAIFSVIRLVLDIRKRVKKPDKDKSDKEDKA